MELEVNRTKQIQFLSKLNIEKKSTTSLDPLLFIIYISDMQCINYADDTTVFNKRNNLEIKLILWIMN